MMKRIVAVALCVALLVTSVFCLAGCSKKEEKFQLVIITDGGTITDGGYNESAWKGVESYAEENKIACRYYQPQTDDNGEIPTDTVKNYIDLSVKNGAEYIVLPGEKFAVSICELAPQYADTKFVLVDSAPHTADDSTPVTVPNVMSVGFDRIQAGFLAGYMSVSLGKTKLGYFGSASDPYSAEYGAGYVQGAAYAADKFVTPIILDYADYDAENLDYDYSFTVRAEYKKIEDCKSQTYKVNVVDGYGSGVYTDGENVSIIAYPAPEGKVFDHWECKSDTDGVRDGKVNISSSTDTTMNLLVGDCDCTISAVWADAVTYPVTIGEEVLYVPADSSATVIAPAPSNGMVFDHWSTDDESVLDDVNASTTNVNVKDKGVDLMPVYTLANAPTFDVTVENGRGSGSYRSGDYIRLIADVPQEGYMFDKWVNADSRGRSTGIAIANEYSYITDFNMVDRYASIVSTMVNDGTQVIFGGGNSQSDSIFTAIGNFDYPVYAFGYGIDQKKSGNCLASVVNDYGAAVKLALADYKGGTQLVADCSNQCIYVTDVPEDNKDYQAVYDLLAKSEIVPVSTTDITSVDNSKCLTLKYWVK